MTGDEEPARIRKKKLEELMKRQQESLKPVIIEVQVRKVGYEHGS